MMSELYLISKEQLRRMQPYFPLAHGVARVDDRLIISGIIYVLKHGLQWKDAPKGYGIPSLNLVLLPSKEGDKED